MGLLTIYHVTTQEEEFDFVESHLMDDKKNDQLLYKAKAACFSSTYFQQKLPTKSVYPRKSPIGVRNMRVCITVDTDMYRKFEMAKTESQVHFLLLLKNNNLENSIADLLGSWYPKIE